MKYERFLEVKKAAEKFAEVAVQGTRNQEKEANSMLEYWVKQNCYKRTDNAQYIVFLRNENLGTKKWSDVLKKVRVEKLADYEETEKTFRSRWERINKDSIIGYLS